MKRWFGPVLLALGILCSTCARAQNDTGTASSGQTDVNVPTQPGPKPAYTYPDATPSLDFLNGAVENSTIALGIGAGMSYVNYGYTNTGLNNNASHWQYNIAPTIRLQQYLRKVMWYAGYSGGFQAYAQPNVVSSGNYNNLYLQVANGGFLWQMARRWQLMANDSFIYSANPFQSYVTNAGTPTLNNPNPLTYTPLTQYTNNSGVLTLTDQLTKTDTLSFTGTSNYRHTTAYNTLTSTPFYNLVSYGGRASYNHQLSARLGLGAAYDYNSLDFGHGVQRSGIQSVLMTADYKLRPNMTISGWIGPEYTSTKTIVCIPVPINGQIVIFCSPPSYDSQWSTAAGANLGWKDLRNSVRVGFSRQVTDGGGLIATSQSNALTGSYRRMLTPKMDLLSSAQYSHVSSTTTGRSFDYFYFNASLDYKLTRSVTARGQYAYVRNRQSSGFVLGYGNYNDNIVGFSINYTWTHPLDGK